MGVGGGLTVMRSVFDGGVGVTSGGIEERSRERGGDAWPSAILWLVIKEALEVKC